MKPSIDFQEMVIALHVRKSAKRLVRQWSRMRERLMKQSKTHPELETMAEGVGKCLADLQYSLAEAQVNARETEASFVSEN